MVMKVESSLVVFYAVQLVLYISKLMVVKLFKIPVKVRMGNPSFVISVVIF